MTRRRELERHRRGLAEIGEIMESMKTLAYMETQKLVRFLDAEQSIVATIEAAAADFLSHAPDLLPQTSGSPPDLLVIGTERGFCGSFNHALRDRIVEAWPPGARARLFAVGHKLHALLDEDDDASYIDGASVAEDVSGVLTALLAEINAVSGAANRLQLIGVYQGPEGIRTEPLLPPFQRLRSIAPRHANPPLLNLAAPEFLLDLVDHYLFAALNRMLYTSLLVESEGRVTHLERAVRHIDSQTQDLARRCSSLRQEEITEEIEVILLSTSAVDDTAAASRKNSRARPPT
jgi:F-type H+-transporting ATPase subunit gamma